MGCTMDQGWTLELCKAGAVAPLPEISGKAADYRDGTVDSNRGTHDVGPQRVRLMYCLSSRSRSSASDLSTSSLTFCNEFTNF